MPPQQNLEQSTKTQAPSQKEMQAPAFRLSKCSTKTKFIGKSNAPKRILKETKHRKRRRHFDENLAVIPIPNFSPISPERELLSKVLEDDPPLVLEKRDTNSNLRLPTLYELDVSDNDDHDDFLPPAAFRVRKKDNNVEKPRPSEKPNSEPLCASHTAVRVSLLDSEPKKESEAQITELTQSAVQEISEWAPANPMLHATTDVEPSGTDDVHSSLDESRSPRAVGLVAAPSTVSEPKSTPLPTVQRESSEQPTPSSLMASIDHLFGHVDDPNAVTVREMVSALEAEYNTRLEKRTKALVRHRLTELVTTDHCSQKPTSMASLIESVNRLYKKIGNDLNSSSFTVRDMVRAVQDEHGRDVVLSKADKKLIREHTKNLVMAGSSSPPIEKGRGGAVEKDVTTANSNHDDHTVQPVGGFDKSELTNTELFEKEVTLSKENHNNKSCLDAVPVLNVDKAKENIAVVDSENKTTESTRARRKPVRSPPSNRAYNDTEQQESTTDSIGPHSSRRNAPTAPKTTVEASVHIHTNATKTKRHPVKRKRQTKTGSHNLDLEDQDSKTKVTDAATAPKRAVRKHARAPNNGKKCVLCNTCSCQTGGSTLDTTQTLGLSTLIRSVSNIEGALLRRLKKMEKTTDWYEDLTNQVRRDLKKHRREYNKKQEQKMGVEKKGQRVDDRSRFLPDAEEWDVQLKDAQAPPLEVFQVQKAQQTLFSYHKNFQPTLTQLLGSSSRPNKIDSLDVQEECNAVVVQEKPDDGEVIYDDISRQVGDSEQETETICPEEDTDIDDDVHRATWRDGTKNTVDHINSPVRGSGVWAALTANQLVQKNDVRLCPISLKGSKYTCSWDQLFADSAFPLDDSGGLEQLLTLFDNPPELYSPRNGGEQENSSSIGPDSSDGFVASSILTQRRENIAETIEEHILSDPTKRKMVEDACPNWRENIRYALVQSNEGNVKEALDNVLSSKRKLEANKKKMLEAFRRQEVLLELYKTSLNESLTYLAPAGCDEGETSTIQEIDVFSDLCDIDG